MIVVPTTTLRMNCDGWQKIRNLSYAQVLTRWLNAMENRIHPRVREDLVVRYEWVVLLALYLGIPTIEVELDTRTPDDTAT